MSDSACGKTRLAFPVGTDPAIIACERAAWDFFVSQCSGCANQECINQLFQQYLDTREKCAGGPQRRGQ